MNNELYRLCEREVLSALEYRLQDTQGRQVMDADQAVALASTAIGVLYYIRSSPTRHIPMIGASGVLELIAKVSKFIDIDLNEFHALPVEIRQRMQAYRRVQHARGTHTRIYSHPAT